MLTAIVIVLATLAADVAIGDVTWQPANAENNTAFASVGSNSEKQNYLISQAVN